MEVVERAIAIFADRALHLKNSTQIHTQFADTHAQNERIKSQGSVSLALDHEPLGSTVVVRSVGTLDLASEGIAVYSLNISVPRS